MFANYPKRRTCSGFSLFIGQAFLYNAITFGFGSILTTFFDVRPARPATTSPSSRVGNLLGPLLLGALFDTVGRRVMISGTYMLSGVLLLGTAWLFDQGLLNATTLTACWCVGAVLRLGGRQLGLPDRVSEVFPMETRAMAIAFFYAIGTAAGGITGPLLFAKLIADAAGRRHACSPSCIGAALMIVGGLVAAFLAVDAEQQSLEDIATPLSAQEAA